LPPLAGRPSKKKVCHMKKKKRKKLAGKKINPFTPPETENPWGKRQRFKNKIAL